MKEYKAKKIDTFRDKYFSTVVYEYRGKKYEVEYANSIYCACTPAWIQHKDEQEKIDKFLDTPQNETYNDFKSIDEQLDEIWEMMGW